MRYTKRKKLAFLVVILAVSLLADAARAEWIAYNDCLREAGDSTVTNVTDWTIHNYEQSHFTAG